MLHKSVSALFVCVLYSLASFAQQDDIDSLLRALQTAKADTNKINILQGLEQKYYNVDNDSALYYNKACEALILQLGVISKLHPCYHEFVRIYHAEQDYKNALVYCLKGIDAGKQNGNNLFQQAISYRALFNVYHNLRQNDSAVKYGLYALRLTDSIGDTSNIATNYGNLCWLYKDLSKMEKAIAYGEQGVAAGKRYRDTVGMLISLNNLANCYQVSFQDDKAIALFQQLLSVGKQFGRRRSVRNAYTNLGMLYFSTNNKNALNKTVTEYNEYVNEDKSLSEADKAFGHLINGQNFIFQNKMAEAETEYKTGIEIAEKDSNVNAMYELYNNLSKLEFAMHNYAEGNRWEDKWSKLDEATRKEELAEYESDLETKYETEKKENEITLKSAQIRQQVTINYFLIAAAVLLLIILLLSYLTYRNRRKLHQQRISELETEKKLTATEAVLKGEEQERTRLAKDLHDGLGGMLSGIKYSLSHMKGNLIMTPDNAQAFERSTDMLDTSIQEMRRVAHNMMPEALVKFGLDAALNDFCNDINQSGALRVQYQSIGFDNISLAQTTAIMLYRIVQELVNNAMKHAQATNMLVQLSKANDIISITVEDDGKGFDTSVLKGTKGMGWSNIKNRIEYVKGSVDVQSDAGKGTSVHIEIPASS